MKQIILFAIIGLVVSLPPVYQKFDGQRPDVVFPNELIASPIQAKASSEPAFRRPSSVVISNDEKWIFAANRDSGTISVVSVAEREVIHEQRIGKSLSKIVRIGEHRFLAADFQKHQLHCLKWLPNKKQLESLWVIDVVGFPSEIVLINDSTAIVFGSWSQQFLALDINSGKRLGNGSPVNLPFAPAESIWLKNNNALLVAAKYTNEVAICMRDSKTNAWGIRRLTMPGFSFRSVVYSPESDSVYFAGQTLNHLARSTQNDVHWGIMVSNEIRKVPVEKLLDKSSEKITGSRKFQIGKDEDGKGDPGTVRLLSDGTQIVAMQGVNQVAFRNGRKGGAAYAKGKYSYVDVGTRPVDMKLAPSGKWLVTSNQLSDSISIIPLDLKADELPEPETVSLGPSPELDAVHRGEQLFFDASLSHDSWISCHSCHVDGHTNGLLNDNLSDQTYGAPKLVISALGRKRTEPFAWNGSTQRLSDQVKNSIEQTMQSDKEPTREQVSDLVAYLVSQPPPPSITQARNVIGKTEDDRMVQAGKKVFYDLGCLQCHGGEQFTNPFVKKVKFNDELGNSEFYPPSLRAVSQRPSLLHDGRSKSLDDLFHSLRHQLDDDVSKSEIESLIRFLRNL